MPKSKDEAYKRLLAQESSYRPTSAAQVSSKLGSESRGRECRHRCGQDHASAPIGADDCIDRVRR